MRSYTWGPLGLISERTTSGSRFFLYDRSGNARVMVTGEGKVVGQQAYTAYGTPIATDGAFGSPFGWNARSGAYRDADTGLVYMGRRYYSPAIGRFIQPDPLGFDGGINSLFFEDGHTVETTDEHPFFVKGKGFVDAGSLAGC